MHEDESKKNIIVNISFQSGGAVNFDSDQCHPLWLSMSEQNAIPDKIAFSGQQSRKQTDHVEFRVHVRPSAKVAAVMEKIGLSVANSVAFPSHFDYNGRAGEPESHGNAAIC